MNRITYTKNDLIDKISQSHNLSKAETSVMINIVLSSMTDTLINSHPGYRLEIRNFGVFEVHVAKAREKARNPRTQELVKVPARKRIKFKPGKKLSRYLKVEWKS